MDSKYDVFISYSRKDTAVADRICAALDHQGISYFIDRQGIGGGQEFPEVLAEAIVGCRIMLYLASRNSYESKFTNNEITFAFNEKPKGSILPYIIDGSRLPVTQRFVFASVNIRTMEEHPIDTVLMQDLCRLLGRTYKDRSQTQDPVRRSDTGRSSSSAASTFDVILGNPGAAKLQVVKAVKEILGLGLKEAKELVDGAPSVIGDGVSFATASALKSYLEDVGGLVDIKPHSSRRSVASVATYSVVLSVVGAEVLMAVKVVKEACGLGLKEAKDLVDKAPSVLREGISYLEAQLMKNAFETCDSEVIVCPSAETAEILQESRNKLASELSNKADGLYDAEDYAGALRLYLRAARESDTYQYYDYDCGRIAYCYYMGYGTAKDEKAAFLWYQKAAVRGDSSAQLNLGVMYQGGYGVERSYKEAARWYQKAARQGNEKAKKYLEDISSYI